jgi:hypothetical protein
MQRDVEAASGEAERDGAADPAAGAGHQGGSGDPMVFHAPPVLGEAVLCGGTGRPVRCGSATAEGKTASQAIVNAKTATLGK